MSVSRWSTKYHDEHKLNFRYGAPVAYAPPVTKYNGGVPVFYAHDSAKQIPVPNSYRKQYNRSLPRSQDKVETNTSSNAKLEINHQWSRRFLPVKNLVGLNKEVPNEYIGARPGFW